MPARFPPVHFAQHPLFTVTPPTITVGLSFSQLEAIDGECSAYRRTAEAVCGTPFSIAAWKRLQHERQLRLRQLVVASIQQNHDQWQAQQSERAQQWREQRERGRLELLEQMTEITERRLEKRRAELEADDAHLRQCEAHELQLLERDNEQRRKNIDRYTELAGIVDAQQRRADDEIQRLRAQLAQRCGKGATDDESSEDDSVYFDADEKSPASAPKSPSSPTSPARSPTLASIMPRSISDILNANAAINGGEDLAADRARNRANVLSSNINLATFDEPVTAVAVPGAELTDAQKIRRKIMREEFAWTDANANAAEPQVQSTAGLPPPPPLTELQRNRQKVMASEFGIPTVVVNVVRPSGCAEFATNKQSAQSHSHTFDQGDDVNANATGGDQAKTETPQSVAQSARSKLKASLSLDLDRSNADHAKAALMKPCQSDLNLSPMSTTSDPIGAGEQVDPSDRHRMEAARDANPETSKCGAGAVVDHREKSLVPVEQLEVPRKPSSLDAPSGIAALPDLLQMLQPSFTSVNIFDISPQLAVPPPLPSWAAPQTPQYQPLNALSESDLHSLNSANLTHFLQQSFVCPFQVHYTILNNEILKIFFEDLAVVGHFNSCRNYFFMMDGEFACSISDGLISRLHAIKRPAELLNSYALHAILENALQSTVTGGDRNAHNLSFCIPNIPEQFDLASPNVLADLHLSYQIEWPLNLVVSDEAIKQYDIVFQYLLKLRRITWLLEQCFYVSVLGLGSLGRARSEFAFVRILVAFTCTTSTTSIFQKSKDINKQSAGRIQRSPQFRHVQLVRHKLVCFVSALQNHVTSVIQAAWQTFRDDLDAVKSMEDLYRKHTKYLKRVKFLCMLNRSSHDMYDRIEDVFVLILRFC